jgi:hypothetical protein
MADSERRQQVLDSSCPLLDCGRIQYVSVFHGSRVRMLTALS